VREGEIDRDERGTKRKRDERAKERPGKNNYTGAKLFSEGYFPT
jgi:hypothetical protein